VTLVQLRAGALVITADGLFADHLDQIAAPATTTTTAWAQSLAGIAIYDLIQTITSLSAGADLIDRALKLKTASPSCACLGVWSMVLLPVLGLRKVVLRQCAP